MTRDYENDKLNGEQLKAIEGLQRALKKCADVKVALYGQSSELVALNGKSFSNAYSQGHVSDDWTNHDTFPSVLVNDHGAYRDSGADDPWYYTVPDIDDDR